MNESKGRNLLAGFDFWNVTTGFTGILMLILNTFTVTVEVFLRRDMGERFFNAVNFYAGMIVLAIFSVFINIFSNLGSAFSSEQDSGSLSVLMLVIWLAYIVFSIFHFVRQWWRAQAGRPVHSLSMGDPRLEPVGKIVMAIVNKVLEIPVRIFAQTLPAHEREQDVAKVLPVLRDSRAFTYRVVEPLFLLVLALLVMAFASKLVGMWLFFSSMALALYNNIYLEMEYHQVLDMRDQMLESTEMKAAMAGESEFMRVSDGLKRTMETMAERAEQSPLMMQKMKLFNPSIAEAMEALNPKLKNMGKKVGNIDLQETPQFQ